MKTRSGYISIMGRPNVGKSTLLNAILQHKISITSPKPQTTRQRLLGIKTTPQAQLIFVDTPGVHSKTAHLLNRYMNRAALASLSQVDVVLWVIEATRFTPEDAKLQQYLQKKGLPLIVAINKIDQLPKRENLLTLIQELSTQCDSSDIIPISAKTGEQLVQLQQAITDQLPWGPFYFPENQITDRNDAFIIQEIIREKLIYLLQQELPYTLTVSIEFIREKPSLAYIAAIIWIAKINHKRIVLGKKGERLKQVGQHARLAIEKHLAKSVYLNLWIKVKPNWMDDERILKQLGYDN